VTHDGDRLGLFLGPDIMSSSRLTVRAALRPFVVSAYRLTVEDGCSTSTDSTTEFYGVDGLL
jgi:hypothetical protein